jgi:hypothetical protein
LVSIEFAFVDFTPSGDTTNKNGNTTIIEKLITSDHETSSECDLQEDWYISCIYIDTE